MQNLLIGAGSGIYLLIVLVFFVLSIIWMIVPFYIMAINEKMKVIINLANKQLKQPKKDTPEESQPEAIDTTGDCPDCARYRADGENKCYYCDKIF